jgi:hypothetical protein
LITIDDPEQIPVSPASGIFYSGILKTESTRVFLFESLPMSLPAGAARSVWMQVKNVSLTAINFNVLGEMRGPNDQPTTVGQVALACYFVHRARSDGVSVALAPGQSIQLVNVLLASPGATVNGIFELDGVRPGALRISAGASRPRQPIDPSPPYYPGVDPWRAGLFDLESESPQNVAVDTVQITPASPKPNMVLGSDCNPTATIDDGRPLWHVPLPTYTCHPIPDDRAGGYFDLHGDYGVLRTYVLNLSNSRAAAARISLYVRPRGGDVYGTFLFDGSEVIQIAGARTIRGTWAAGSYEIKPFYLKPGEHRQVRVETMGQGESAYPAELFVLPTVLGIAKARHPRDGIEGPLARASHCTPWRQPR